MRIQLQPGNDAPIYQQIVAQISAGIESGQLAPGEQLPTVRQLADESGMSRGTVKQAYDTLEHLGLIEKTQGRGTFVRRTPEESTLSKKEQALDAIDAMLDVMEGLHLPMRDVRIYLDLKLREREGTDRIVRVGLVDCNPEALSVINDQVSAGGHVDVYEYDLHPILESPVRFGGSMDVYVTTRTHMEDLAAKMNPGQRLLPVVMSVAPGTVLELARIQPRERVGILCASERFASIILRACEEYCILDNPPEVRYFGTGGLDAFIHGVDRLILPANYQRMCTEQDRDMLVAWKAAHTPIIYHYEVDRGSLLNLEDQINLLLAQPEG